MKNIKIINKYYLSIDNDLLYKGYLLGDLPPTFSFLSKEIDEEDGKKKTLYGINKWFNYKGLTWIKL